MSSEFPPDSQSLPDLEGDPEAAPSAWKSNARVFPVAAVLSGLGVLYDAFASHEPFSVGLAVGKFLLHFLVLAVVGILLLQRKAGRQASLSALVPERWRPWAFVLLVAGSLAGMLGAALLSSPSDAAGNAMVPGLVVVAFVAIASLTILSKSLEEAGREGSFLPLFRGLFRIGALVLGLVVLFVAVIAVAGAFQGGQG